ncbi:MAG: tRNA (adenosine(37)-N6)-dimethylallyltransferase MiaA [Leptospiraceae bacterium]|nr:tRNA (adenosine(37)-N6)-dimethylallyltransferase MiaA [Leptospiraceae bacterium]
MGPTGSGKTALISRLPGEFFEAVSIDSRQVYRHMPISVASPTTQEQTRVRHHLLDCLEPDQAIDAAWFVRQARASIDDILKRGKLPILVGGSGFYLKALRSGMPDALPVDAALRLEIQSMSHEERLAELMRLRPGLVCTNSARLAAGGGVFHPNDQYRVQRHLELARARIKHSRPMQKADSDRSWTPIRIEGWWIDMPRPDYWAGLEARIEAMLQAGLQTEVMSVYQRFGDCHALSALGCLDIVLQSRTGRISRAELARRLFVLHRQYGKRQRTWFRKETCLQAIEARQFDDSVQGFLNKRYPAWTV